MFPRNVSKGYVVRSVIAPLIASTIFSFCLNVSAVSAAPSDIAWTVHTLQTTDPALPSLPSGASPKGTVGSILSKIFWGSGTQDGKIRADYLDETDPKIGTILSNYLPKWNGTALVTSTIFDNGNVGIGIAAPQAKLHVAGWIIAGSGVSGAGAGASDAPIWTVSSTTYPDWGIFYNEWSPDYIEYKTAGTISSRIVLDDGSAHFGLLGGKVGIGVSNPSAKLDVNGGIRSSSLLGCGKVYTNVAGDLVCGTDNDTLGNLTATGPIVYNSGSQTLGMLAANSTTSGYLLSADWNTFNNKVGWSGTSGYVPKWTAAGTIGNSVISDNGTNVGFGVASPRARVDVAGSIISGDSNGYGLFVPKYGTQPFGANFDRFEVRVDPLSQTTYMGNFNGGTWAARALSIAAGNTEWLRVDTNGYVGIGTSAPTARLTVNGWAKFGLGQGMAQYEEQPTFHRIAFNELRFYDWNTGTDMLSLNDGKIGIGTTSASAMLHVGTGWVRINSLGNCSKVYTDASGNLTCWADFWIGLTALSASAPLTYNNTTGAFGITQATSAVNGYLSSADWSTFNGKQAAITGGASSITTANLTANRALLSDATGKVGVAAVTSTELGYLTGATSNLQAQINAKLGAGSETDPQVGANTTNYLSKWDGSALVTSKAYDDGNVLGTDSARLQYAQDGAAYFWFRSRTGSEASGSLSLGIQHDQITGVTQRIAFKTGNGDRMLIDPSGNVGIGTTSPATRLHVATGGVRVNSLANCTKVYTDASGNLVCGTDSVGIGLGNLSVSAPLTYNGTTGAFWITQATTSTNGYLSSADWNAFNGKVNPLEQTSTDFNSALNSGFHQDGGTAITGDVPDSSHVWSHLIASRHSNTGNNYQLQIGGSYATNDRLFFRKIENGNTPSWNEMATRGANTFVGTQAITGNATVSGNASVGGTLTTANLTVTGNMTTGDAPVFRLPVYGRSGQPAARTANTATPGTNIGTVSSPFGNAMPTCPIGNRYFKIYAEYAGNMTGWQTAVLRIALWSGTNFDNSLPTANVPSPSYRSFLSSQFQTTDTADATVYLRISGTSGPYAELSRAEIWMYCK